METIVEERHSRFVRADSLASECDVAVGVIYRMIRMGRLPAVKIGRGYRIPREAAEALLGGPLT